MTIFSRVCTTTFLHDHKKFLKAHRAVAAAKRTSQSFVTWRHRHRRARSPPSTLFSTIRRKRSRPFAADCRSLQQLSDDQLELYSRTGSLEIMTSADQTAVSSGRPLPDAEDAATGNTTRARRGNGHGSQDSFGSSALPLSTDFSSLDDSGSTEEMPPPAARHSRSTSSASRTTNRLSITLPIALPTSDPSRPVPSSSASAYAPSIPGTPSSRHTPSSAATPIDANEMIIAIAAQERRVMELREELGRAEDELKKFKRQWTMHEATRKSSDRRLAEQARSGGLPRPETTGTTTTTTTTTTTPADDDWAVRRSVELDRRKLILQTHQATTPKDDRKRVFQGRHARTLSLLSPTKPSSDEAPFVVHEDGEEPSPIAAPDLLHGLQRPAASVVRRPTATLNKRATWQPQYTSPHAHTSSIDANPMSQIVEDFKLGFKTFYEDIRQITVGDEPVNGGAAPPLPARTGSRSSYADDQETIRPSTAGRPKLAAAFDYPEAASGTTTPSKTRPPVRALDSNSSAAAAGQKERNARARNKHFSWTPLSFEGIDGDAWLTFDSPGSVGKSTRWSGSTMNEEEQGETREMESPLSRKSMAITSPTALSPRRLEELTATVVNRLSPSNIKRTASEYMTQWEQSLADSVTDGRVVEGGGNGVTAAVADVKVEAEADGGDGKENASRLLV